MKVRREARKRSRQREARAFRGGGAAAPVPEGERLRGDAPPSARRGRKWPGSRDFSLCRSELARDPNGAGATRPRWAACKPALQGADEMPDLRTCGSAAAAAEHDDVGEVVFLELGPVALLDLLQRLVLARRRLEAGSFERALGHAAG